MKNYDNSCSKSEKTKKLKPSEKSVLRHFFQMNNDPYMLKVLLHLIDVSAYAFVVLIYCASKSNRFNEIVVPQTEIKRVTGFSISTIKSSFKLLEEYGFIYSERHQKCNKYYVNARFSWKNTSAAKNAGIASGKVLINPIIIPGYKMPKYDENHFIQISTTAVVVDALSDIAKKCPTALKVLLVLVYNVNEINEYDTIRQELANKANCSLRAVADSLNILKKKKILNTEKIVYYNKYILSTDFCFKNKAKNIEKFGNRDKIQRSKSFDDGIDKILKERIEQDKK
ncbi:MAG: hypothetical protein K6G30_12010 [Acetatifactor sp.]|nr:hypothetical protein [Acetatifactor sp.]